MAPIADARVDEITPENLGTNARLNLAVDQQLDGYPLVRLALVPGPSHHTVGLDGVNVALEERSILLARNHGFQLKQRLTLQTL